MPHGLAGGFAEAAGGAAVVLDEAGEETFGQAEDILGAFAQGRQVEHDHVEAVEQVLAELALGDHRAQVAVGRGKDAHIGAAGHRIADAFVFLVLDEAQQLGLQGQREVADLVEEQGAAVSLADPAQGAFGGTGEGAATVPEQFAFHQFGGQRRAVDGDLGLLRAFAPGVDGACQFALAGAGFAEDEDVGVGRRDLARGLQYRGHGRAVRFQAVALAAHFVLQGLQARGQLAHLQLLGGGQAQLVRAAGLDQVIHRAGLHGVDRGIHRRMRGDDHHAHPWRLDAHLGENVEPVVFAQAQVEEAQVEYLALQQGLRLRRAAGGGHAVAFVFEAITESAQDRRLVIDQQDAPLFFGSGFHRCFLSSREFTAIRLLG
ncbi:Uncharacterized protein PA52Ts1_6347 [Pseudomonas aeruginosa]|nr:Uncharacterized protein PA52Ts1_6347 [Pseudomonas aeruginosa]